MLSPYLTTLVLPLVVIALLTLAMLVLMPANLILIPALFSTVASGLVIGASLAGSGEDK